MDNGGRGGIRTHGGFNPTLDFESSAFNRTQPPFLFFARPTSLDRCVLIMRCGDAIANLERTYTL
jgi:hypothetical protein